MFHFSSNAWSNAYTELCDRWVQFLAACISHQVDFLQATEICSLSETLKRDDHSDFRSCIPVGLLERFLSQINMHTSALNRITFNIVSSTQAGEHIKAQQGDQNADCDSMILISICYGKQTIVCEERGQQNSANVDGWVGSAFDTEFFPNDIENHGEEVDGRTRMLDFCRPAKSAKKGRTEFLLCDNFRYAESPAPNRDR